LAEPINSPQALAQPRPPILIGGGGERKTLRMVAEYADAANLFVFAGPAELARKLDVLKHHCDRLGRNYDEISKTVGGFMYTGQPVSEIIDQARPLAALGFDHVMFNVYDDYQGTPIERLGREVVPALAEM
jgi:alkanesulfonate monooxygenase